MSFFVLGADLGQAQDYTALTVIESHGTAYSMSYTELDSELRVPREVRLEVEGLPAYHQVRHLERVQLGTPYPAIVDRIGRMVGKLPGEKLLGVDATGVGRPVVDLLEAAWLSPYAITITAGDTVQGAARTWRVPKRDLVGVLQVAFQARRLQIAAGLSAADLLLQELMNFKVKITAAANDTYGAWREGVHDDLVLAVAIACWLAEQAIATAYQRQIAEAEARAFEASTGVTISSF